MLSEIFKNKSVRSINRHGLLKNIVEPQFSGVGSKICGKCGHRKKFSDFGKNKRSKSGLTSWCLDCMNVYSRKYRAKIISNRQKDVLP